MASISHSFFCMVDFICFPLKVLRERPFDFYGGGGIKNKKAGPESMVKKIQDEQLVKIKRQDATDKKKSGPVLSLVTLSYWVLGN